MDRILGDVPMLLIEPPISFTMNKFIILYTYSVGSSCVKKIRFYTAAVLLGLTITTRSKGDCDPELFRNYNQGQASESYNLAMAKIMDITIFNEIKNSGSAGGGASFLSIGINANTSFQDFKEQLEHEIQRIGYTENFQTASAYVHNSFDGPGVIAYQACLDADTNANGLIITRRHTVESTGGDKVTLRITYRPAAGAPRA